MMQAYYGSQLPKRELHTAEYANQELHTFLLGDYSRRAWLFHNVWRRQRAKGAREILKSHNRALFSPFRGIKLEGGGDEHCRLQSRM